jgi:beta-lactamase superfamily II metal-dependent hydrolase
MHIGRKVTHLTLAAGLLLFAATAANAQLLRLYYPDIEQGSSTLVVSPTGQALLVDAGTGIKTTDDGVEEFINDLIDAGVVTSLDFTLATHYDEDHIGRMENVFQLVPMAPGAIAYDRGTFGGTPSTFAYSDYSFGASQHNRTTVPVCTVINLGGGVTATVMTINGEVCGSSTIDISASGQFENSASVTVLVEYGDFDVWIGGDLTGNPLKGVTDVESDTGPEVGDVDVYTFNHHGSETSSNATFLGLLKAEVGINQNSASNGFGHPRAVVVNSFLSTPDTDGLTPFFFQQNPGDPADTRSDDTLADAIADCDDVDAAYGLPGTITLLSDGTSYRIHACGIPATTFPADEGLGTLGDYPPAIRRVLRTPQVPLATEGVTVEADVEDAATVEIRYWLDGVEQTPVPMTLSSGITYTGTIPAQTDGARIKLRVEATDSSSQTELSPAQGYFSGTTPIATLRINDADGVLVPKRYGVRVEANVTVEPGVFHTFVTQGYAQDATGGVQIFAPDLLAGVDRGDLVEFRGELEQFGGQTEVSLASGFGNVGYAEISAGTTPAPQVVTISQVGEATEGELIRINDVTIVSGTIPESGNANVTITDDGGTSTLTLRIDGDTDIPGANTPTQSFDVIGVGGQFDSWVPLDSGYQVVPRERADLITDEVNHPPVLISEIHADPASGISGDANGDGVRDAGDDEFIELVNTGYTDADISGWTLADGVQIRHTFPPGTVIPAREAVVVFGGGTPNGDFGNAAANGLVFTASTGALGLNNSGDTVTLADDTAATVQSVTYGSEGGSDESLVRDPDFSNAPFVQHTNATGSGGSLYSPGTRIGGQAFTVGVGSLLLSEVLYDASGSDNGLEWIELYNPSGGAIDLDDLCIGAGGGDYTNTLVSLSGSIASGATFVLGGPTSSGDNGNPTFDLEENWSPDLQNSGSTADGVALFNLKCAQVTPSTVPIDAVVYGGSNTDNLIDETGSANSPEVGDTSSGESIERTNLAGSWQIQSSPTPNSTSLSGSNAPPSVSITAPADSSTFTQGASIGFTGTASDAEDGDLTSSLTWSSNLDGSIGTGGSFSTSTLSVGTHTITASVTDSGSEPGSDSITVTIEASSVSLVLSEVFYDASGSDNGLEWVEIYNAGSTTVDLSGYSLGNGGSDYTYSTVQLSGTVGPGQTFVVGGPTSSSANGNPTFDQVDNWSPDFQNSGSTADGVALFDVTAANVTSSTVPIDAVVYGSSNSSNLIDETGSANAPEVGDASSGESIERTSLAGSWQIQSSPTPNSTPL